MYTKNCVRCLKPAKFWSGHVRDGKGTTYAGWCSERCHRIMGFKGLYRKDMGKIQRLD
jgi:hypothetical protein